MNLIIREFPDNLADRIKGMTGFSTLSKAVLCVAGEHEHLVAENNRLHAELERQRAELRELQGVIEGARQAAVQLFERTSQTELRV